MASANNRGTDTEWSAEEDGNHLYDGSVDSKTNSALQLIGEHVADERVGVGEGLDARSAVPLVLQLVGQRLGGVRLDGHLAPGRRRVGVARARADRRPDMDAEGLVLRAVRGVLLLLLVGVGLALRVLLDVGVRLVVVVVLLGLLVLLAVLERMDLAVLRLEEDQRVVALDN